MKIGKVIYFLLQCIWGILKINHLLVHKAYQKTHENRNCIKIFRDWNAVKLQINRISRILNFQDPGTSQNMWYGDQSKCFWTTLGSMKKLKRSKKYLEIDETGESYHKNQHKRKKVEIQVNRPHLIL